MPNVPDYSQYVAVKKVRAAQTGNSNAASNKGRISYRYDGYFPLYRSVGLPVNALLSNKFTSELPTTPSIPPGPFSPLSISGLGLWLDGSDPLADGTSLATNTTVSTWYDKSSSNRNAISQASPLAVSQSVTIGTDPYNILLFNQTGSYKVTYPSFPNTAYTVFMFARTTGIAFADTAVVSGPYSSGYGMFIGNGPEGYLVTTKAGNGSAWNDSGANTPNLYLFNEWRIVSMTVSSDVLTPHVNGTAQDTRIGTTTAFSDLAIGRNTSVNPYEGYVGEIIIYSGSLGTTDRQKIEGYLAWKWGIQTSLPTNHPYYTEKP